jgi:hypothetical protein
MGLSAVVFLAHDVEFERVFRGWKRAAPPLDIPIVKTTQNPFTGETVTIRTRRNPASPFADADAVESPALKRFEQAEIHGIDITDMAALVGMLLGCDRETATDEIIAREVRGPVDSDELVWELPEAFVYKLADITDPDSERLGKLWAAKHAEDAATIQDESARAFELAIPEALWVERLQALTKIIRAASNSDSRLYLWMSY